MVSRRISNTQLFALPAPPPEEIVISGTTCRLRRVFKHDFFAATCLYEADANMPGSNLEARISKRKVESGKPKFQAGRIVVKFYRTQPFCGLPMAWLGRISRNHERAVYRALAGVPGVPRYVGDVGPAGWAIEYLDARPLDHFSRPPAGYFGRLRAVLEAVHARGVAYVDANKRSNLLVGPGGEAFVVDFQISLRRRDDWPRPMRALSAALVRYLQTKDIYHLCKHKRRLAPGELTEQEDRLSRRRGLLHRLHAWLIRPYKALRRGFLSRQFCRGRLVSPSADLEDHRQPEKDTWRRQ